MSETVLDRIVAAIRAELAERKARVPLDELRARAAEAPVPRPFAEALRPAPSGPARLIAEVKRASPSKGVIAEEFDPITQAQAYERGGAAAISVLTEPRFFLGSLDHLTAVRAAVSLPVLRKDFILDPYQVYEARAAGADAVLLICALLDEPQLADLLALTRSLGMEALVEAHTAAETRRAVDAEAKVIGVNSRDLSTFAVKSDVVRSLRPLVPNSRVFVAESGIGDVLGATRARAWGADAILVGEALMRASFPEVKTRELATAPGGTISHLLTHTERPFTKICGLVSPEQAQLAAECGADAVGFVFAPQAPPHRRVTPEQARQIAHIVRGQSLALDHMVWATGVFVNEPLKSLVTTAYRAAVLIVQLSGDESPEVCKEIVDTTTLSVMKALRLRSAADLALLDAYVLAGAVPLLDTPSASGEYGGTGKIGNWELAREAARRWPIILSGGLTPENVASAIKFVSPRGVDVSSGVETNGVKEPEKIRAFVRAARTAAETANSTEVSV